MSKKGAKKKVEDIDPTQVPDPNVGLYLRAIPPALPATERILNRQSAEQLATIDEKQLVDREEKILQTVREFGKETAKNTHELEDLKAKKKQLEKEIAEEEEEFSKTFAKLQCDGEAEIADLQEEVDGLRALEKEADQWVQVSNKVKREVDVLENKISNMEANNKEEILALHEKFRNDERKLREALVKKLRRTRDFLTAAADNEDDADAEEKNNGGNGDGGDSFYLGRPVASTKLNERLSREVSMYERESKMVRAHNDQMLEQEQRNRSKLEQERAANEKLVLRNASHTKTKRVLDQKLKELQEQCDAALLQHNHNHKTRVTALHDTIESQNKIIDDLHGELEVLLNEYEGLRKQQQAAQEEANQHFAELACVQRFAISLPTDPELPEDSTPKIPKPPSSASGSGSSSALTVSTKGGAEIIPHLGINNRLSAANFIATLVSSA